MAVLTRLYRHEADRDDLRPAHAAGRWHLKGQHVLYAADSWSTAALEILASATTPLKSLTYVAITFDVPDDLIYGVLPEALPVGWDAVTDQRASQAFGSAWYHDSSLPPVLCVPSVAASKEASCYVMRRYDLRLSEVLDARAKKLCTLDPRIFPHLPPD